MNACELVRKIYGVFDFDKDNELDKIEFEAFVDCITKQISLQDPTSNV